MVFNGFNLMTINIDVDVDYSNQNDVLINNNFNSIIEENLFVIVK